MAERAPESLLVQFYRGRASDAAGRTIGVIWEWDRRRLEMVHDYIQWLFPIPEASRFNPDAPVLTPQDAAVFRTDADLKARLGRSFAVMMDFYGLDHEPVIARGADFAQRAADWLTPLNHNYLRLTRIMICLTHCGLELQARALLKVLEDIADREGAGIIAARTRDFWRQAVTVP
jgi:hypothetical protein